MQLPSNRHVEHEYFRHEAMSDLIALMANLVDAKGKILVPGIYDTVARLTPEEEKLYDAIDFDMVRNVEDGGGESIIPVREKSRILNFFDSLPFMV